MKGMEDFDMGEFDVKDGLEKAMENDGTKEKLQGLLEKLLGTNVPKDVNIIVKYKDDVKEDSNGIGAIVLIDKGEYTTVQGIGHINWPVLAAHLLDSAEEQVGHDILPIVIEMREMKRNKLKVKTAVGGALVEGVKEGLNNAIEDIVKKNDMPESACIKPTEK